MTTANLAGATHNAGAAPIKVSNAGLVLLQAYLPLYFERCGLTRDGQFADAAANHRAVRLVHLLASRQWAQDEVTLPLAKIMCGISVFTPLMTMDDAPTEGERDLCDSLLAAVMQHWDSQRGSSIDGLRGNFLMRDGRLTHQSGSWQLDVEKRPYDVLLGTFPLSFAVIKFAWMPEPLRVQWPW
ncbi:contractile injection system tape measure protein [Ralstonia sp. ASV6]|uniref:contractile injection system tape measure protein n=1 Tax=Ralstonia sp. ASV6 TaxID=2795124 RepID=UPI0018EA6EA8|nr:contractile injection system tape measure protein [Ralstonia sp. ASV6]